jgi:hypothetical protein
MASKFALVTTANNELYRMIAANLILSSREHGDYTWYLVADQPLGIGENFIRMPDWIRNLWESKSDKRYLAKFQSLELAFRAGQEEYLVHIDADCVFKGPPAIDRLCDGREVFALLEENLLSPGNRKKWFMEPEVLERWLGVLPFRHPGKFFNLNGGFFGLRRGAWEKFMNLVNNSVNVSAHLKIPLASSRSEEPYLSYAIHQMSAKIPGDMLIDDNLDIYFYTGAYPERPAYFENWGTGKNVQLPEKIGIVHIFNKHKLLAEDGAKRLAEFRSKLKSVS